MRTNTRRVGHLNQPPRCAFPARARFLREELGLTFPAPDCPEYRAWHTGLQTDGISLVFSSAYANNPASMFGHTLLRLSSPRRSELLDYGINYAAIMPPDVSTVSYVVQGILGGYRGGFSLSPYYLKVNEYTQAESRDLIEYELELTGAERERFLEHLWELRMLAQFDYYFFDENCSYQLLAALEAAKPEWELTSRFGAFVLPSDTARVLAEQPGAVRSVRLRPSNRRRWMALRSRLNGAQLQQLKELVGGRTSTDELHDPDVADAALAHLDFVRSKDPARFDAERGPRYQSLLLRRTRLGVPRAPPAPQPEAEVRAARPDLSHRASLVGLRWILNREPAIGLQLRPGLHDLLDDDTGFHPFSQIEALSLSLDYRLATRRLDLDELKVAELTSLEPWDALDARFSWHVSAAVERVRELETDDLHLARARAGGGGALGLDARDSVLAYALATAEFGGSPSLPGGFRYGPGLMAGFIGEPYRRFKAQLAARALWDLHRLGDRAVTTQFLGGVAWSFTRDWQIRAQMLHLPLGNRGLADRSEWSAAVRHYF